MTRLLAALILSAGALLGQPAKETPFLEWRPVAGAGGYLVQVRDAAGKIVVDQRVQQSRIDVNLPPGKYQQRVAVLNKFQKPGGYSDWLELDIRVATPAKVEEIQVSPVPPEAEKKGERAVAIQGDNFNRETKVFVETNAGKVEASRVEVQSDKKLIASFDSQKLDQGRHDILLENPRNKITRIENAVRVGEDKKLVTTGVVASDVGREPGKDPGRDPGREPGREPGKQGDTPSLRPIYPEYKETTRKCGRAGICQPAVERYSWNMRPTAFIPGLTQIRAGDKTGYAWIGVLGGVLGAAISEDRRAEKVAKRAASDGLGPIFSSPLVFGTYSLWTQPTFLILANNEFKNQKHLRNQYQSHIQNRNVLLGSAVILYAFQIIDAALAGSGQKFHFRNPVGTGPMPMQTNLANSTFTWKFDRDVWVPGRVRSRAGSPYGKVTAGALIGLGTLFGYELYESNRLINGAVKLRESTLNQAVTTWIAPLTSGFWTNPAFVYAVGDNNRQFQSLRRQFHHSRQRQILYAGSAAIIYFVSVFDAASYSSDSRFFDAAKIAPGANPLPMADIYCAGGPCIYSPAAEPAFKFTAAALVPGRVRKLQGHTVTGNILLGATIGTLSAALYKQYESERLARAATSLNNDGLNAIFSNTIAFAGTYSLWTDTTYVVLFSEYYRQLRRYSRSYARAQQTRNVLLSLSAGIYLAQFLDAGALSAGRTSSVEPELVPEFKTNAADSAMLRREREAEQTFYAAQSKMRLERETALDAKFEYSAAF